MLELKEVRGALLGEACGDALGYPLIHFTQDRILSIFGKFGLRLLVRNLHRLRNLPNLCFQRLMDFYGRMQRK